MTPKLKTGLILLSGIVLGAASMQGLRAQQAQGSAVAGVKNTDLVMRDLDGAPNRTFIVASGEIPVGGVAIPHSHQGDTYHYLLEGEWQVEVGGKALTLKPGQGIFHPRGEIHGGKFPNGGKLLSFYVLDKGFPRVVPAK